MDPATRSAYWAKGVPPIIEGITKDLGDLDPSKTRFHGFFVDSESRYPQGREVMRYWLRNEIFERYTTDAQLIQNMNANTVRITANLGSSLEKYDKFADYMNQVLDEFWRRDVMVIMTVAISKEDIDSRKYLDVVNAHKNHPAILMWAIGDEWNLNRLYSKIDTDILDINSAAEMINLAARDIKYGNVDTHHPVCSILGDKFDDYPAIFARCPYVDVWGVNVYRKTGVGDFLRQWQEQFQKKPVFISEFGTDSFYTQSCKELVSNQFFGQALQILKGAAGHQDEKRQADIDIALWNEIKEEVAKGGCLGGVINEFNDSLWKVGNCHIGLGGLVKDAALIGEDKYDRYDNEGIILGILGSESNEVLNEEKYVVLNEEHCGLVTADRSPKLAYSTMKERWAKDDDIVILDNPPVLQEIGNKDAQADKSLKFSIYAWDSDKDSITLTAKMADGSSLDKIKAKFTDFIDTNNGAGCFEWTPSDECCGDYAIVFTAASKDKSVSETIIITVLAVPRIDSLTNDSANPKKYIIEGKNFGQQGAENYLTFKDCEIIDWSDKKIIFQVNESLEDGIYTVGVHTSKGSSENKEFEYKTLKDESIEIIHIPLTESVKSQAIPVEVKIKNRDNLACAPQITYYKRSSSVEGSWDKIETKDIPFIGAVPEEIGTGVYKIEIPAGIVYGDAIKYGIYALDKNGKIYKEEYIVKIKDNVIAPLEIVLKKGWNLVSLPVVVDSSYTAEKWAADINSQNGKVTKISRWDGNDWQVYDVKDLSGNYKIEAGKGYFIWSNKKRVFSMTPAAPAVSSYNLDAGINIIGISLKGYTAKSLSQLINAQGGKITKVKKWTGSGWQVYNVDSLSGDFEINPNEGIVLYASGISAFHL